MEPNQTPTPEIESVEFQGYKLPKEIYNALVDKGRQTARGQMAEEMKSKMIEKLNLSEDFKETRIQDIIDRLPELTTPREPQKKIDPADEIAKAKAEFQTQLKTEKEIMVKSAILSEVTSSAIAHKLDESYKGPFKALFSELYEIEIVNDKPRFIDSNTKEPVYLNGEPATAQQIAAEILKKFPKLTSEPVRSPSLDKFSGVDTSKLSTRDTIKAGLAIMKL
jgi:hypothetical protein